MSLENISEGAYILELSIRGIKNDLDRDAVLTLNVSEEINSTVDIFNLIQSVLQYAEQRPAAHLINWDERELVTIFNAELKKRPSSGAIDYTVRVLFWQGGQKEPSTVSFSGIFYDKPEQRNIELSGGKYPRLHLRKLTTLCQDAGYILGDRPKVNYKRMIAELILGKVEAEPEEE